MALVLALDALAPAPGLAQNLADPTRPPAEFLASPLEKGAEAAPIAWGGQIIILSGGRKQVTVNGQIAQLGSRLGNAIVIGITDAEITTKNPVAIDRQRLYGSIQKRMTNLPANNTKAVDRTGREALR